MVVPHIADLMGEQPSAELTEEPSIAVVRTMLAYTVPITGPVPLRQVSRSGRLPVQRPHRVIATTRHIATRHRTIIRHTDRFRSRGHPSRASNGNLYIRSQIDRIHCSISGLRCHRGSGPWNPKRKDDCGEHPSHRRKPDRTALYHHYYLSGADPILRISRYWTGNWSTISTENILYKRLLLGLTLTVRLGAAHASPAPNLP